MNYKQYKYLLFADFFRYDGKCGWRYVLKQVLLRRSPGQHYSFWFRLSAYLRSKGKLYVLPYKLSRFFHRKYTIKYGIEITPACQIGPGLYIGHFGGIHVPSKVVIGKNCNISQGVTVGVIGRGTRKGAPVIGDNVYIAPGVKIIGNVKIGNNVAIGANAVVTKDLPDNSVAVGVPATVISSKGSGDYINRIDYDKLLNQL